MLLNVFVVLKLKVTANILKCDKVSLLNITNNLQ